MIERKLDEDKGRRLGGLASLGPLGARLLKGNLMRIKEGKLEKDKGRRLGGLASLGPFGARLYERQFEANFSYGYEKLAKKKRAQRRKNLSKSNGRQRERRPKLG